MELGVLGRHVEGRLLVPVLVIEVEGHGLLLLLLLGRGFLQFWDLQKELFGDVGMAVPRGPEEWGFI